VVEGSTDGENWVTFDRRSESDVLNSANATGTFWTFREKEVRQVRLRPAQTGWRLGGSRLATKRTVAIFWLVLSSGERTSSWGQRSAG
jgi:hypothetical protein